LLAAPEAFANPEGGQVVGGSATIVQQPGLTSVHQSSDRAIINWRDFSIGHGETTRFIQPGANAIALNRVTGNNPSHLFGNLEANGNVWLINPNGILIGPDARIDVNGFLGTTTDIRNEDFLDGRNTFSIPTPHADASVINEGTITIGEHGLAGLVGPTVRNDGVIQGRMGQVVLAGASTFTLDFQNDGLIQFALTAEVVERLGAEGALVRSDGAIDVDGGTVLITADAAAGIVDEVINVSGIVEARSFEVAEGTIVLSGGDEGLVTVAGSVSTAGAEPGVGGGSIDVLGEAILIADGALVDASGPGGGGHIHVGGDFKGDGPRPEADVTVVAGGARLEADSTDAGTGGTIVVWGERYVGFAGLASVEGAPEGGDGGFVETSSRGGMDVTGTVATGAPSGRTGTWLIDPTNVRITADTIAGSTDLDGGLPDIGIGEAATTARITPAAIAAAGNVVIEAEASISIEQSIDLGGDGLGLRAATITQAAGATITAGQIAIVAHDPAGEATPGAVDLGEANAVGTLAVGTEVGGGRFTDVTFRTTGDLTVGNASVTAGGLTVEAKGLDAFNVTLDAGGAVTISDPVSANGSPLAIRAAAVTQTASTGAGDAAGTITAGSLVIEAAGAAPGAVVLAMDNDVDRLAVGAPGAGATFSTLVFRDVDGFEVADLIGPSGGTVAGIRTTTSVALQVPSLTQTVAGLIRTPILAVEALGPGAGAIVLGSDNDVDTLAAGGGNRFSQVTFNDTDGFGIGTGPGVAAGVTVVGLRASGATLSADATIEIGDPLDVGGGTLAMRANSVTARASSGGTDAAGTITAGSLVLRSNGVAAGTVSLDQANAIDTLAVGTAGAQTFASVTVNDQGGLTVGTVAGVAGVTAGAASLATSGALAIEDPIAVTGTLELAANAISQTASSGGGDAAGTITAAALGLRSNSTATAGSALLTQPNAIDRLAAGAATGALAFVDVRVTDQGGLAIGTVDRLAGLGAGSARIETGGALTIDDPIQVTDVLSLTAASVSQNPGGTVTAGSLRVRSNSTAAPGTVSLTLLNAIGTLAVGATGGAQAFSDVRVTDQGGLDIGTVLGMSGIAAGQATIETSGALAIEDPVQVTGTLALTASSISQTEDDTITAGSLLLLSNSVAPAGAGTVTLSQLNQIDSLAVGAAAGAQAFASVQVNDQGGLSVGTVGGVAGVTAGAATLETGGVLSIEDPIDVASGTLSLLATGVEQDPAGTITAAGLVLRGKGTGGGPSGTVTLSGPNAIGTVAAGAAAGAQVFASITLNDSGDLTIGAVDGVDGLNAGQVTLTVGGTVTVDGPIVATTDAVTLTVGGDFVLNRGVTADQIRLATNRRLFFGPALVSEAGLDQAELNRLTTDDATFAGSGIHFAADADFARFDQATLESRIAADGDVAISQDSGANPSAAGLLLRVIAPASSRGDIVLPDLGNAVSTLSTDGAVRRFTFAQGQALGLGDVAGEAVALWVPALTQAAGTGITASTLAIEAFDPDPVNPGGPGAVILTGANDVDRLAIGNGFFADPFAQVAFSDTDGFTVDQLAGVSVDFSFGQTILSGLRAGTVTLRTPELAQTAGGSIVAGSLAIQASGATPGAVTLTEGIAVDRLAIGAPTGAASFSEVSVFDRDGFTLDQLAGIGAGVTVGGIRAGSVAVRAPSLTQTAAATITAGALAIEAFDPDPFDPLVEPGAVTLSAALNDVDRLAVGSGPGAASFTNVAFADGDGLTIDALPGVQAGVTLSGLRASTFALRLPTVTQAIDAPITAQSLVIEASGPSPEVVTLGSANDVDRLAIGADVGSPSFSAIRFADQDSFTIDRLPGPSGAMIAGLRADTVALRAPAILQAVGAPIIADSLALEADDTIFSPGPVSLTAGNDVDTFAAGAGLGASFSAVAFRDVDDLEIGVLGGVSPGVTISGLSAGTVALQASSLTQVGAGTITAGSLAIEASGPTPGTVALSQLNDVDRLAIGAAPGQPTFTSVTFRDTDGLTLDGLAGVSGAVLNGIRAGTVALRLPQVSQTATGGIAADSLLVRAFGATPGAVDLTAANDVDIFAAGSEGADSRFTQVTFVDGDDLSVGRLTGAGATIVGVRADSSALSAGGSLTLDDRIDVGTGTLVLRAAAVTQTAADDTITAGSLAIQALDPDPVNPGGPGAVLLTQANRVDRLAVGGDAGGDVFTDVAFVSQGDLEIGSVAGAFGPVNGIRAGAVALTVNGGGDLTVASPVEAVTGAVSLDYRAGLDLRAPIVANGAQGAIRFVTGRRIEFGGANGANANVSQAMLAQLSSPLVVFEGRGIGFLEATDFSPFATTLLRSVSTSAANLDVTQSGTAPIRAQGLGIEIGYLTPVAGVTGGTVDLDNALNAVDRLAIDRPAEGAGLPRPVSVSFNEADNLVVDSLPVGNGETVDGIQGRVVDLFVGGRLTVRQPIVARGGFRTAPLSEPNKRATTLLLVTRGFTNERGADGIQVEPNARFLVYSADPATDTRGIVVDNGAVRKRYNYAFEPLVPGGPGQPSEGDPFGDQRRDYQPVDGGPIFNPLPLNPDGSYFLYAAAPVLTVVASAIPDPGNVSFSPFYAFDRPTGDVSGLIDGDVSWPHPGGSQDIDPTGLNVTGFLDVTVDTVAQGQAVGAVLTARPREPADEADPLGFYSTLGYGIRIFGANVQPIFSRAPTQVIVKFDRTLLEGSLLSLLASPPAQAFTAAPIRPVERRGEDLLFANDGNPELWFTGEEDGSGSGAPNAGTGTAPGR
jgi:filamentous hemagglutinin family protein